MDKFAAIKLGNIYRNIDDLAEKREILKSKNVDLCETMQVRREENLKLFAKLCIFAAKCRRSWFLRPALPILRNRIKCLRTVVDIEFRYYVNTLNFVKLQEHAEVTIDNEIRTLKKEAHQLERIT